MASTDEEFTLPDTVIGIGKAGKEVIYTMMQQEWIQEKMLEKLEDGNQCHAYSIDTAMAEKPYDIEKVNEINETITDRAKEKLRKDDPVVQNDYINYVNTIDSTNPTLVSVEGLTSEGPVADIVSASSIKSWWLRQSRSGDDVLLRGDNTYSDGVFRRRALSKALYHASQTGDDPLDDVINTATMGNNVYIVCGIGGGTGSGMFLDIAKEINDSQDPPNIHLFAIIPGTHEKKSLRANANAALSELEYLSLTGAGIFTNKILLPVGLAEKNRKLDEFDRAVTQAIISHRNLDLLANEIPMMNYNTQDGPASYAPFTIAVPQILEYNAGKLQDAKDSLSDWLDEKIETLDIELELYERLTDYIVNNFDDTADNLQAGLTPTAQPNSDLYNLNREQALDLRDRLDDLQDLLERQVFDDLDMGPAEKWREQIGPISEEIESNQPDDASRAEVAQAVVTRVANIEANDDDDPESEWTEDMSIELAKAIRGELRAIRQRAHLYMTANTIEEEPLKEGLRTALHEEEDDPAFADETRNKLAEIKNDLDDKKDKKEYLDDLTDVIDKQNGTLDATLREWRNDTRDDFVRLTNIMEHEEEIQSLLTELNDDLKNAVAKIQNAGQVDELPSNPVTFDKFDSLNFRLQEVDKSTVDEMTVRVTIDALKDAKTAWLESSSSGLISGLFGGDDKTIEFEQAIEDIDEDLIEINNPFKDNVNAPNINYVGEQKFDKIIEDLEQKSQDLSNSIVQSFREEMTHPDVSMEQLTDEIDELEVDYNPTEILEVGPSVDWPGDVDTDRFVDELESHLRGNLADKSVENVQRDLTTSGGIVYRGVREALLGPITAEQDKVKRSIRKSDRRRQRYKQIIEIISSQGSDFSNDGQPPDLVIQYEGVDTDDPLYVNVVSPGDNQKLLRPDDIDEADFWGTDEQGLIESNLKQFARNVASKGAEVGIEEGEIKAGGGSDIKYKQHRVINVIQSRMFETEDQNINSNILDEVQEIIRGGIDAPVGKDGYKDGIIGYNGRWDIAMTTFISGIMLDNLSPMVQPNNGYLVTYHDQRDELLEDVLVRHTHGLDGVDDTMFEFLDDNGEVTYDRGAYVARTDNLNLDDQTDKETIVNSDISYLQDLLLSDYLEFVEVRSTFDIDEITR